MLKLISIMVLIITISSGSMLLRKKKIAKLILTLFLGITISVSIGLKEIGNDTENIIFLLFLFWLAIVELVVLARIVWLIFISEKENKVLQEMSR